MNPSIHIQRFGIWAIASIIVGLGSIAVGHLFVNRSADGIMLLEQSKLAIAVPALAAPIGICFGLLSLFKAEPKLAGAAGLFCNIPGFWLLLWGLAFVGGGWT